MDDGRGPGVEKEEASQDLTTPASDHLQFGPKPPHVTGERERERERERDRDRER